jgi:L,D-transpeptidase catalytic domain
MDLCFASVLIVAACLIVPVAATSSCAEPAQTPPPPSSGYRIAIHCSLKVLQLWLNTELIKEYPIEVGKGGLGKRANGDHRTPIGDYKVSWMASRNSSKGFRIIDNRSWCEDNRFLIATTGPSLEKLWADPYGGDEATVININYPNEKDKARGFTGECIHIHADKKHKNGILGKSYGCIHMFPKDAMELYEKIRVGTPVKILP